MTTHVYFWLKGLVTTEIWNTYFLSPSPSLSSPGDADWSDYALWWPDNRIWLNKPRQSLYAYGIMSDAKLEFSPVHRYLTVELPNKHRYQVRVNFAVMTFFTVAEICNELNIRHPEEMSLLKSPDDKEGYAKLTGWIKRKGKVRSSSILSSINPQKIFIWGILATFNMHETVSLPLQ